MEDAGVERFRILDRVERNLRRREKGTMADIDQADGVRTLLRSCWNGGFRSDFIVI